MKIPFSERMDIDLARCDDPRDVAHLAVECLAKGGIVAMPTESGHVVAAALSRPEGCDRLAQIVAPSAEAEFDLFLKGMGPLSEWARVPSASAERLIRKLWPGAAAIALPTSRTEEGLGRLGGVARHAIDKDRVFFRLPSHEFPRNVLRLSASPLLIARPESATQTRPMTRADAAVLTGIDMLVDLSEMSPTERETRIEVSENDWRIVQEGAVKRDAVARAAGTLYVFVCTGNTCRSPMAEAIFRARLASRLGRGADELEALGHFVASAGVSAFEGQSAAKNAIETVKRLEADLGSHRSRRATAELIREADHVIAMAGEHLDALMELAPEREYAFRLLLPDGSDLDDPYGADMSVYRRTAEEIDRSVTRLLDDLRIRREP